MCGGCCGSRAGGAGGAVDGRVANGVRDHLGGLVGVDRRQLTLDYVGLNHLGWVRGASVGGNDVWPELFGAIVAEGRQRGDVGGFDPSLIELLVGRLSRISPFGRSVEDACVSSRAICKPDEKWPCLC